MLKTPPELDPFFNPDRHVTVALIPLENKPFVYPCIIYEPENCTSPGVAVDLFLWMINFLQFTFTIKLPPSGTYGTKFANGTWDGVVGMLHRREADMTMLHIYMTAERLEAIDYGPVITDSLGLGFLTRAPTERILNFPGWKALQWPIWMWLLISTVAVGTYCILLGIFYLHNSPWRINTYFDPIWILIAICSRQAYQQGFPIRNNRRNVFLVIIQAVPTLFYMFGCFIVVKAFEASMIDFLRKTTVNQPFKNLHDATRIIKSGQLKIMIPKSHMTEFWGLVPILSGISEEYIPFVGALHNNTNVVYASDKHFVPSLLADPNLAYFGDYSTIALYQANVSGLTFVSTQAPQPLTAFAFTKNFTYYEEFAMVGMLIQDIVLRQIYKNYFVKRIDPIIVDGTKSISYTQLSGAWEYLIIGLNLSLVGFIVEFVVRNLKMRNLNLSVAKSQRGI